VSEDETLFISTGFSAACGFSGNGGAGAGAGFGWAGNLAYNFCDQGADVKYCSEKIRQWHK
jgi:hypothetical protein